MLEPEINKIRRSAPNKQAENVRITGPPSCNMLTRLAGVQEDAQIQPDLPSSNANGNRHGESLRRCATEVPTATGLS